MSRMSNGSPSRPDKVGLVELAALKRDGTPIVMVTAYDFPSAQLADEAGVDIVFTGDSAANNVLGYADTTPISMDEMVMLGAATRRGTHRAFYMIDMPLGAFQVSDEDAVRHAVRLVKETGAEAVKIEGGGAMVSRARAIVAAGIPTMGHLGLTPQSATMLGGYKAQGRTAAKARQLFADALASRRPAASRSCWRRCRRAWQSGSRRRCTSRPLASARARSAPARCWSGTTCWASTPDGPPSS